MSLLDKLETKIIPPSEIETLREKLKGKTIVFTNGCFDILHPGHVTYLTRARELGDVLWIGVNSDASVKRLKGATRPINSLEDRMIVLAGLFSVDYITGFSEDTPIELLKQIKPNVHTKGGDYVLENLPEYPFLQSIGARIEILPFVAGKSTTNILQKAKTPS